ncbi:AAA family ATPase [Sutterella sp.]|uniref:AAA family ATPase n=1 Tax=Sutterella sp. TaxID=1981025 RepID=UPI0026DFB2B7|nr:AAA family ATPase [Sutterella sp.]MDO5532573.1 AAA family ATPase [Sutterella sp.]
MLGDLRTLLRGKSSGAGGTKSDASSADTPGWSGIGGLTSEVARVRAMIELPLLHPDLFEKLGQTPPRGLLMFGPPGCGKTLIARTVAKESGLHFITVNSPGIIRQNYGQSEAQLREIFDEAESHQPSVIFFDEFDALAPNRDHVLGDLEKRVVSQLLALMDGVKGRGRVIVMAATNRPNSIDPALRRPGRFDREIEIRTPDREGRREILAVHTRKMPLADDVVIDEILERTPGFVGADLAAVAREAALAAVNEYARQPPSPDGSRPEPKVAMRHFEAALSEIHVSSTREFASEVPEVHWADVVGLDDAKHLLREAVELPLRHGAVLKKLGLSAPAGILLTGAPGTGKTLLAHALATESDVSFIAASGPDMLSKWVGDAEKGIRNLFEKARQSAPSVIFIDEADALLPERRRDTGSNRVMERIVGQFLLEMDANRGRGVLVLAATGRPDILDRALLHPGRFEVTVELPLPDLAVRERMFSKFLEGRTAEPFPDPAAAAEATDGFSGADIAAVCRRALMEAFTDELALGHTGEEARVTAPLLAEAIKAASVAKTAV